MPRSLKCAVFAILVAAGQVVAQTSDAVCGSISFTWEVNSKGQSPCIVASTIISYTQNSPFNLWALQSQPARYPGPVQTDEAHWGFNRAVCSMVTYSLLAGCAYCQGSSWPSWPEQIQHCNSTYLGNDQGAIKGLPIDVPSITAVPSWAEFDYSSLTGQTWDPVRAQLISQQAAGNGTNTGTDNSDNGGGKKKSSIAGPVAGGVVGGVAVILAVIGAFWWRRRRLAKRRQSDMQDLSSEKNASDNGKLPSLLLLPSTVPTTKT
ncbi:hypothetical protein BT69DRAFT_184515 [Atractiella rhizophila]|nr:hypothetical protein BT69DRAFT_184515 [Atractiella rhizophila]